MATSKKKSKEEKVRDAVDRVFRARTSLPGLDDLVGTLLDEFGGVREFARTFHQHFDKTDSPMTRSRMLESVMRLVTMAAGQRKPQDLDVLTDDELRDAAAAAMSMLGDDDGEIAEEEAGHAEPAEPPAGYTAGPPRPGGE